MTFSQFYLQETAEILTKLDTSCVERLAENIASIRENNGRLFIVGIGGSAANASHAACDFRKLAHVNAYSVADNVAELTARTNDTGWYSVFEDWLVISRLSERDGVLVFSVGGGTTEVSPNIVCAVRYARHVGAKVFGIVGKSTGYTAQVADTCLVVPEVNADHVTQHAEETQGIIWHLLVSHPKLKQAKTTW